MKINLRTTTPSTPRHVLFLEAGIHAREWIAPASAAYLVHRLAEGREGEECMMTRNFDWHVVVVANPDGYEYSRNHYR